MKQSAGHYFITNIVAVTSVLLKMELVVLKELAQAVAQELVTGLLLLRVADPEGLGERSLAEILHVCVEGANGHGLPGVVAKKAKPFSEEGVNHL
jgi:hypothetical protein